MSVINVEHISKLYGDKMILEDLSSSALMQLTGLEPVPSQPGLDP